MQRQPIALLMLSAIFLAYLAEAKCVYTQPESGLPYIYDGEAFPINYTM
jgi:hypothetical protein